MKKLKFFLLLFVSLLSACGGGSSSRNYSAVIGLALDDPAAPTKLYVANADNQTIQTLNLSTQAVTVLAGGANVSGVTDGTGAAARFNEPFGIVRANSTDFYVADTGNHGIRKLTSAGVVTTLAGNLGTYGATEGTTAAKFYGPKGLDTDGTNVYVADTNNHIIRKVVISTGMVSTLAGYPGAYGLVNTADGSPRFYAPFGVAYSGGNLYVTDLGNNVIRKVTLPGGVVSTLAGSATGASGSNDATGSAASFRTPTGIVADVAGNYLYVADTDNHIIRKINISTGLVSTLAGTAGSAALTDGSGNNARFNHPVGLVLDNAGNLYVSDQWYTKIRKVDTSTGAVTTLAATF